MRSYVPKEINTTWACFRCRRLNIKQENIQTLEAFPVGRAE